MLSIGILGTGAIGSLMAYHWQDEQLFALNKLRNSVGIKVQPLALGQTTPVWQQQLPAWQGQHLDWLVVCTKAADTLAALQPWQAFLPQCDNILLIQNGLGQQQQVADWLAQQELPIPLWAGMCTEGAYRQAEQVVYAGIGKTLVGRWPNGKQIASSLSDMPDLPTTLELTTDITAQLRQKLAINAVINPLTGYYRCLNGELVSNPVYFSKLLALSQEVVGLYQQLNWPLPQPLTEQAQQVALATANNRSSTLQDIEANRPTELAFISGYLLEQAHAIGYSMPLTEHLLTALTEDEHGQSFI